VVEEKEEPTVAKVYNNSGTPSVGLRMPQAKEYLGKLMVIIKCEDPEGAGWPFGYHVWFKNPSDGYADLRCECLEKKEKASTAKPKNTRASGPW
jgi:hypothetical protein